MKNHHKFLFPLLLTGGPCLLASISHAAIISGVTVTDSATPFSADYAAAKAVDGDFGEYASQGKGADTFLTFAFPAAQAVDRVVVLNRDSPAPSDWISNFTLTFDGGATASVTRAGIRGGSAIISLGATYLSTTARLDVDTTGDVNPGGNTGAMEVFFLSAMTGKSAISGVSIYGSATPFNPDYAASNAIDGILGRTSGGGLTPEYASQGLGLDTYLDFDLGAIQPVAGFDFFDRPAGADRVTGFDMIFSGNNIFGDGDDVTLPFTNAGMATSAEFASINARYVRYDVTATSGGGVNNGLNEIVFYAAVPEPSVSITALAALAGFALRRRKR